MNILFLGQRGVPHLGVNQNEASEQRAWALAKEYAALGHEVAYLGTPSFLPVRGGLYQGVLLKKIASLDPEKPGGLFYLFLSCLEAWRWQPEIVQVHGWLAIRFIWLLKRVLPAGSQLVLTVDQLPHSHRLAQQVAKLTNHFFGLVVPSRQLQYKLLVWYGLQAQYIPDGFTPSKLPQVPLSQWNLKPSNYTVVLADSPKTARQAIKQIKGKQRIILLQEEKRQWKRLSTEFSQVRCVGELLGRSRQSVLNGAARVILADETTASKTVLTTMAAGVPLVAIPANHYQELLGATARFAQLTDLAKVLKENTSVVTKRAKAAARRANQHFTWERSAADYLQLAAPNKVLVPVDSVQPKLSQDWQRRVLWA